MTERTLKRRFRVEVTEDDIAHGRPRNGDSCPVYLACTRSLGRSDIHVALDQIQFNGVERDGVVANLPKHITRFISRFDWGMPVKPTRFVVVTDEL